MRHQKRGKKLNRNASHRVALRRNLARSLLLQFGEKNFIVTTREKAKFVQPFVEKLITLAKNRDKSNRDSYLAGYRRGLQLLRDESAVHHLFEQVGPHYRERPGGYTRIIKTSDRRLGDKASQVIFGFVQDLPGGGEAREGEPAAAEA